MFTYRNYSKNFVRKLTFEQVKKKTLGLMDEDFNEEAFYRELERMES